MNDKYCIDKAANKEFMHDIREGLLAFGHQFPAPTGASYYLGDDGTPWKSRPRETWITCRMAHVYSIGTLLGHEGSEELADAALGGLLGELHDNEYGGWHAGVKVNGKLIPGKQCYAHAFVMLAGASAKLVGRPDGARLLEDAVDVFESKFWDGEEELTFDTWDSSFTTLDSYRGLNANMHTVEAFLALADVLDEDKYRERAGKIIDRVIGWASDNDWRIPEHYTADWEPDLECNSDKPDDQFKPYGATPGHGIEWARLIVQWAMSTYGTDDMLCTNDTAGDDGVGDMLCTNDTAGNGVLCMSDTLCMSGALKYYVGVAAKLYNRAIGDGWFADGEPGIVYTTDWDGKPVVHDRMHWTLAEAINTSAVLYRVTGEQKYADEYAMFCEYLDVKVLDHVNGSWFHQLNASNEVIGTVWPGKSDIYHALQATLIPYCAVDTSVAVAVAKGKLDI